MKPIRFTRGSRTHKIGRSHARHVIETQEANQTFNPETGDPLLTWVGEDDRGLMLEIVAVELTDELLVIHVMPIYRERKQ